MSIFIALAVGFWSGVAASVAVAVVIFRKRDKISAQINPPQQ